MADETTPTAPLSAGSTAPDFSLPARSGKTISLHDFRGSKDVLIYFYPKDDTPGCTRESCSLRDGWSDLQKAGIEVLGISRDDSASHNAFATKYNLPFELLTDANHAVHEAYGSWGQLSGNVSPPSATKVSSSRTTAGSGVSERFLTPNSTHCWNLRSGARYTRTSAKFPRAAPLRRPDSRPMTSCSRSTVSRSPSRIS